MPRTKTPTKPTSSKRSKSPPKRGSLPAFVVTLPSDMPTRDKVSAARGAGFTQADVQAINHARWYYRDYIAGAVRPHDELVMMVLKYGTDAVLSALREAEARKEAISAQ